MMDSCVALVLAMFLQGTPTVDFYEKFEPQSSGPVLIEVIPTCQSVHVLVHGYFCPIGKTQMGENTIRLATDANFLRYCYVIEKLPFAVVSNGEFISINKRGE